MFARAFAYLFICSSPLCASVVYCGCLCGWLASCLFVLVLWLVVYCVCLRFCLIGCVSLSSLFVCLLCVYVFACLLAYLL